jgi:hypothetical protein
VTVGVEQTLRGQVSASGEQAIGIIKSGADIREVFVRAGMQERDADHARSAIAWPA